MYKLELRNNDGNTLHTVWFNFLNHARSDFSHILTWGDLQPLLVKYNCYVDNYQSLCFDSEEDAMVFILRWS